MSVGAAGTETSFMKKLSDYLQDVDYRIAVSEAECDAVFKLRYRCYLGEGAIKPNASGFFKDDYDDLENCWIFGIHLDGELVASMRFHLISPEFPTWPALDVFPDIIGPKLNQGMKIIDPTRLVVDPIASKKYPELVYITMRIVTMACEYFEADSCLATVRSEHRAYYRRVFQLKQVCEPRHYPSLLKPICLMAGDLVSIRDKIAARYPVFVSSFTERRLLFEQARPFVGIAGRFGVPMSPFMASTMPPVMQIAFDQSNNLSSG